jgi:excisionase family DNA binding protein
MIAFNFQETRNTLIVEKHITVKNAAEITGYNPQYLRRLLRLGKLNGIQIGQVWLIKLNSLENYLSQIEVHGDHRYGPRTDRIQT